tara:strand:- start:59 stop:571 length:513 start_codon:yes stop_codon:yes gene_type:complete
MQKIDDIDRKILDILIENTRTPFTDIAKRLLVSPGTVHVRVKKLEDSGIIKGSSLNLDYTLLGYSFIAYIGVLADRSGQTYGILESLKKIPHVTVAHLMTGKYNVICKIRAKNTKHAKDVIMEIEKIEGIQRLESMISLDESINDKKRLMKYIFTELSPESRVESNNQKS